VITVQDNNTQSRKDIVVDFLKLVVAGRIDEGYRKHVAMNGKHHNQYFSAGFPALKRAMIDNHTEYPDKRIDIKRVIAEGDVVASHSLVSLNPGNVNVAVVHIFRFEGDKIAEFWDVGQEMKADSPNTDGMF
jgi:predicted SnoaL-like aldol condensation-catalyzing enzyme